MITAAERLAVYSAEMYDFIMDEVSGWPSNSRELYIDISGYTGIAIDKATGVLKENGYSTEITDCGGTLLVSF
jgi:hypothetical protein